MFAIPAMALTTMIMAYSGYFTPWSILIFYALWLPLSLLKGSTLLMPPKGSLPAVAYLALCFLSLIWSDYRAITFRAAMEFASVFLCLFVIVRVVPVESYAKGIIAGIFFVLLASVASGRYGQDPFSGAYTLVGLFGSKNQLGFYAEVGIFLSIIFWFSGVKRIDRLLYVPFPIMLSTYCLYVSRSATSVASLIVTLLALFGFFILSRLPKRTRKLWFISVLVTTIIIVALGATVGLQDEILHFFGKDSTLTGRTYLWSQGFNIGMRNPFTGIGYVAFWVPGRSEAENLWYRFGIYERGGFHFHNTYIETFVELGIPGFLVLLFWMMSSLFESIGCALAYGLSLDILLPLGISIMLFVRSFVEIDIASGFGLGPLLLVPVLPWLKAYKQRQKDFVA